MDARAVAGVRRSNSVALLIKIAWLVFLAYWAISAFRTTARRRESIGYAVGLAVLGYVVLSSGHTNPDLFGNRIFPRSFVLSGLSVALTWSGIALAIWARWHLGQYWSGRIRLREDHKLIRTGPYARLRHPIYSGLDLAAIGTVLAIDRWQLLSMGCILILAFASLLTASLGLLLGTVMDPRKMQMLFAVILLPATMLGCVYYPWSALHHIRWLQIAVLVNPMVYMSEGLRAVLTPVLGHMPLWAVLLALVGGTVVFGYLGIRSFTNRVLN